MAESVRVIVRCRPANAREKSLKCASCVDVDEERNQIALKAVGSNGQKGGKGFTFDGTYGTKSKTATIYAESAASLVESVLEGFNATVFAYGQTGCGKSFTMEGPETADSVPIEQNELAGIIPRACADLFDSVALAEAGKKFLVHASYLEIYNENVRDLLVKTDGIKHLELKEHPDRGVYVKGLSMHRITSSKQAQKLMSKGWSQRATGETLMNQDSSRSHAIFTIYVETEENDNIRAGKLHLVDLAGSERQSKTKASGQRLKEAAKINLSLSALGNVISALVDGKSKHIPYRDSKLTRILQDSLGGNTKTLMIACVSPADNNYDETLSTLRYADRAKKIKNAPKINEDPKDALLRQYQQEILELKKMLQGQLGADGLRALISNQKAPGLAGPVVAVQQSITDVASTSSSVDSMQLSDNQKRLEFQLAEAIARADKETEQRQALQEELTLIRSKTNLRHADKAKRPSDGSIEPDISIKPSTSKSSKSKRLAENLPQVQPSSDSPRSPKLTRATIIEKLATLSIDSTEDQQIVTAVTEAVSLPKIIELDDDHLPTALESASANHEKQLARLLELQRGFVRSTHIEASNLENIRRKKNVIRSKQAAAEKRRELAKRAVAAQDDEEMFQALFENVHEDVRFQRGQVEKARNVIKRLKDENADLAVEFERERANMLSNMREQDKQVQLLEAIIDKIQPTVKRDCNYSNIDKIKKQAVWDEEQRAWKMPQLMLMSQQGATGPGVKDGKTQLSARQQKLLGGSRSRESSSRGSMQSSDPFAIIDSRPRPRRLRPLGDDFDF